MNDMRASRVPNTTCVAKRCFEVFIRFEAVDSRERVKGSVWQNESAGNHMKQGVNHKEGG